VCVCVCVCVCLNVVLERLLTGGASPPADLRRSLSLSVELLILSISSCCFSNSSLSFLAALLTSWRRLISA